MARYFFPYTDCLYTLFKYIHRFVLIFIGHKAHFVSYNYVIIAISTSRFNFNSAGATFKQLSWKQLKVASSCLVYCMLQSCSWKRCAQPFHESHLVVYSVTRSKHQRHRHYHDVSMVFHRTNLLKMVDFKWTDEKTEELISMFECRPWLYNVTLKENLNRDKKRKRMEEIANHFGLSCKFLTRVS